MVIVNADIHGRERERERGEYVGFVPIYLTKTSVKNKFEPIIRKNIVYCLSIKISKDVTIIYKFFTINKEKPETSVNRCKEKGNNLTDFL